LDFLQAPLFENDTVFLQRAASSADLQIIERGLDRLSIHEGPFYDVVKKANARPKKSKFLLHRFDDSKMYLFEPIKLLLTMQRCSKLGRLYNF